MKKCIMTICLVVMVIVSGNCHAEQNWLEPSEMPFIVDPNVDNYIVAVRIEAEPLQELRIEQLLETHIWPVVVTFDGLPAWAWAAGPAVFMQPAAADVGLYYWQVTAVDSPPFFIDPVSVTGTWTVQVVPSNPGPVFVPFVR